MYTPLKDSIILMTPKWSSDIRKDTRKDILCTVEKIGDDLICMITIPTYGSPPFDGQKMLIDFPVVLGNADISYDKIDWEKITIKRYGLSKLGPGTWKIDPKIDREPIHAHIVLCECPDPAPWEDVKRPEIIKIGEQDASRLAS